jgi:hypothetical protein
MTDADRCAAILQGKATVHLLGRWVCVFCGVSYYNINYGDLYFVKHIDDDPQAFMVRVELKRNEMWCFG